MHDPTEDIRNPTLPDAARTLHALCSYGALATLDPREGYPYTSLVEVLPDTASGDVLFLLSDLAAHTTNLKLDPRASLLMTDPLHGGQLLARQRGTLMGQLELIEDRDAHREAWLARHPQAVGYIDFSDFNFYRLRVERVRYIAGFGRMDWLDRPAWEDATPDPLAPSIAGIVEHMNEDHAHNLLDYARHLGGLTWAEEAKMLWIDQLGFDMEVRGEHEESPCSLRLMFSQPVTSAGRARAALVEFAQRAREAGEA